MPDIHELIKRHKKNPTDIKLIYTIGEYYYSQKQTEEALHYFKMGLKLNPNDNALKSALEEANIAKTFGFNQKMN